MLNQDKDATPEPQAEGRNTMSRRDLLASLGVAGIALTSSLLLPGTVATAQGDNNSQGGGGNSTIPQGILSFCEAVTIAKLRAKNQPNADCVYYVTDPGKEGPFMYDPADTTTANNTGTVIVSQYGGRFKRIYEGAVNVKWFGAKGDGIADDSQAFQLAVNTVQPPVGNFHGAPGGVIFIPDGSYRIASTVDVWSNVVLNGNSIDSTRIIADLSGFAFRIVYLNNTISNLSIIGTVTQAEQAIGCGIDMTQTPHYWNICNVRFSKLLKAFEAKGGYMGTMKDVYVLNCGNSSVYACWLGTHQDGYQTNTVNYTNFHIEGTPDWVGKGLYVGDMDHSFTGLHIEHILLPDAFTSDAEGIVINGLYAEHHSLWTDNKLTFNKNAVIHGGVVNCQVVSNERVEFYGTRFLVTQEAANKNYYNCIQADFRHLGLLNDVTRLPAFDDCGAVNIPLNNARGTFDEWAVGMDGDEALIGVLHYFGSSHQLEIVNGPGQYLTTTRGCKVTKISDVAWGGSVYFTFPEYYANKKIYAWAIYRVPSPYIQVSFGLGGIVFEEPHKLVGVSGTGEAFVVAVVGPVVPFSNYVTFTINKPGGGNPPNGEFFYIDSFGVSVGGVDFDKLFNLEKDLSGYRYATALPATGQWRQGDKIMHDNPAAGGHLGWICVESGQFGTSTPPTFKTYGAIEV